MRDGSGDDIDLVSDAGYIALMRGSKLDWRSIMRDAFLWLVMLACFALIGLAMGGGMR